MSGQQDDAREYPRRSVVRDQKTDITEQERILQDNIIGQKATTEGTTGEEGTHAPTGDAAREGTAKGQQ